MLRHYDTLGLVCPTGRTVGGYREYRPDDIRRIFYVEGLRSLGLSLREIGRTLDDPAFTPSDLVGGLVRKTEQRLNQERELLERLRTVDAAEPSGWQAVLRIVELLRGLGSEDAARRQQALLTPGDEASIPADLLVDAVLGESDPNVAGTLRWILARAGADGVAGLASGLDSDDVEVRRRAVAALAELSGDEVTETLAAALGDSDVVVRRHAALALGARGEPRAVPTLVDTVVDGPNDVEAAELLGMLARDARSADRIMAALVGEIDSYTADSAVRMRLTQAFAEMPGTLAREVLQRLAADGDRAVALLASTLVDRLDPG